MEARVGEITKRCYGSEMRVCTQFRYLAKPEIYYNNQNGYKKTNLQFHCQDNITHIMVVLLTSRFPSSYNQGHISIRNYCILPMFISCRSTVWLHTGNFPLSLQPPPCQPAHPKENKADAADKPANLTELISLADDDNDDAEAPKPKSEPTLSSSSWLGKMS